MSTWNWSNVRVSGPRSHESYTSWNYTEIGHFWVHLSLHFKAGLSTKSLLWKSVFNDIETGTNYHKENFALSLALKERPSGTRKWPIVSIRTSIHEFHVFISSYCFYWFFVVSMLTVTWIHDTPADSGFNTSSGLHLKMISTIYGLIIDPHNGQLPVALPAQLVEQLTSITEVRVRVQLRFPSPALLLK